MSCKENKSLAQIISGAVCGILMLTSIIVYLVLGITLNFWHPGWLIPACAGIACGIVGIVGDLVTNIKQYNKNKDENNQSKE